MTTPTKLSPKRAELIERMRTLAFNPNDTWQPVPGYGLTVRYSERGIATPDWARYGTKTSVGQSRPQYPFETYDRHVFLTVVSIQSAPILRVARTPWVGATDHEVSLTAALRILDDPASKL